MPRRVFLTALLVVSLLAAVCSSAHAQEAAYVPLGESDLQSLAAPVALYPDALLAQILVACTYPSDVVSAAQYLDAGSDPNAVDNQGWDISVAGIARYPDLVHYMATNGDWMNSLGAAFLYQQADVMNAVQTLRGEAIAAGNLVSNDEQQVVTDDDGTIEIVPTNPQTIYPPIYDANLVYQAPVVVVGQPYAPLVRYWRGIPTGPWLHHDLDWHDHAVYLGSWGADRPWWRHAPGPGARFDYTHDRPGLYAGNQNIPVNVRNQVTNIPGGRWNRPTNDPQRPLPRPAARPAAGGPAARPGAGYAPRNGAGESIGNTSYRPAPSVSQQRSRGQASLQAGGIRPGPSSPAARSPQPGREPAAAPRSGQPSAPSPEGGRRSMPSAPQRSAPAAARPEPAQRASSPEPTRTPAAAPVRSEPARSAPEQSAPSRTPAAAPVRSEPARSSPAPERSAPSRTPAAAPARSEPARSSPAPERSAPTVRGGATSGYTGGAEASRSSSRGASSRGGGSGGGAGGRR